MIHKTAIINPKAKISPNVQIGAYSIIGPNVEIKDGVIIHSHVNITGHTLIGENNIFWTYKETEWWRSGVFVRNKDDDWNVELNFRR